MAPGIMCFGKKPENPESRRNEEIEKTIRNDRRRQEREVKLLLLGMAPCGGHMMECTD
jgi:guanine nucleotide-binding protein subunit alpha